MDHLTYKLENDGKEINAYEGDKEVGKIVLSVSEKIIIIESTFVDEKQQGKGIARALVKEVVDLATKEGKKIIPLCPYAQKVFDETPEYKAIQR